MRVGLGTGSTVAYLLPALAERKLRGLRCVATSPATEQAARALGLNVEDLDAVGELDIAIDGADQVDPSRMAGEGRRRGADTREDRRGGVATVRRDRLGREGGRRAAPAGAAGAAALRRRSARWRRWAKRGCAGDLGRARTAT